MKHRAGFLLVLACILVMPVAAVASDDIEQHRSCAQCGMDRKAYGYSRMLIQFEDGRTIGVCSLHCAVKMLFQTEDHSKARLLVADRKTRGLIDAKEAVWVMGGSKRGVMTQMPKWAFKTKPEASEFIKSYGGKLATWDEALAAVMEETSKDRQ